MSVDGLLSLALRFAEQIGVHRIESLESVRYRCDCHIGRTVVALGILVCLPYVGQPYRAVLHYVLEGVGCPLLNELGYQLVRVVVLVSHHTEGGRDERRGKGVESRRKDYLHELLELFRVLGVPGKVEEAGPDVVERLERFVLECEEEFGKSGFVRFPCGGRSRVDDLGLDYDVVEFLRRRLKVNLAVLCRLGLCRSPYSRPCYHVGLFSRSRKSALEFLPDRVGVLVVELTERFR